MDADEQLKLLIEQARHIGVRVEFDSGLVIAKRTLPRDPKQDKVLAELAKWFKHLRPLLIERAIGARAKDLVGQRIWYADGEGTLISLSDSGAAVISLGTEVQTRHDEEVRRVQTSITAKADSLMIVLDEEAAGASSPHNEQPRTGIRERLGFAPRK
jgi:hypothetical protein